MQRIATAPGCKLQQYLAELSLLIGRAVCSKELSSTEAAKALSDRSISTLLEPQITWTVPFSEKSSRRFLDFISRLAEAYSGPVAVFTARTGSCGFLSLSSIRELNMSFPFEVNTEGIVSFAALDSSDRLLFDFFCTDDGKQMLEVEVQGKHWVNVEY